MTERKTKWKPVLLKGKTPFVALVCDNLEVSSPKGRLALYKEDSPQKVKKKANELNFASYDKVL